MLRIIELAEKRDMARGALYIHAQSQKDLDAIPAKLTKIDKQFEFDVIRFLKKLIEDMDCGICDEFHCDELKQCIINQLSKLEVPILEVLSKIKEE